MKAAITRAGAGKKTKKGLIIVHTGDGKGKTTAALGLALRTCGYDMKVIMLQFFEGKWKYGELRSAPKLETFEIHPMGKGFTWESKDVEVHEVMVREAWRAAQEKILSANYDVVVRMRSTMHSVMVFCRLPILSSFSRRSRRCCTRNPDRA